MYCAIIPGRYLRLYESKERLQNKKQFPKKDEIIDSIDIL